MKKGQVNTLIILIGLFIVLYLLLIPPEDREALLNETSSVDGVGVRTSNILLESPGRVTPTKVGEIEHNVGSMNLFSREDPESETLFSSLSVSRSFFSNKDRIITFNIKDIEDLNDLFLTFIVERASGDLVIEMNDNVIFRGPAGGYSEVALPLNLVRETNELVLYSDSVGFKFWDRNYYDLHSLKLRKEFERVHSSETRTFVLSDEEKSNLERSTLEYFIYCNDLDRQSFLRIYLNDNQIQSGTLGCVREHRTWTLDKSYIKAGVNELMFVIDEGDFLIDSIMVKNVLKESSFRSYSFFISDSQYDSVLTEEKDAILEMKLDGDSKVADIVINDRSIRMDVTGDSYVKDISDYINEGTNDLEILPLRDFEIRTLRIDLK